MRQHLSLKAVWGYHQEFTAAGYRLWSEKKQKKKVPSRKRISRIWTSQIYFRLMLFSWCVAQSRWKSEDFEREDMLKVEVKKQNKLPLAVFKDPEGLAWGLGGSLVNHRLLTNLNVRKRWRVSDWWGISTGSGWLDAHRFEPCLCALLSPSVPLLPPVTQTSQLCTRCLRVDVTQLPTIPCSLLTVLLFSFKVWHTWWWAIKVWTVPSSLHSFTVPPAIACVISSLKNIQIRAAILLPVT